MSDRIKIIFALEEIGQPSSPSDISWKTGLGKEEVLELLQRLEADEVVTKAPSLSESMADVRFYVLTNQAKRFLKKIVASRLEEMIAHTQAIRVTA